MVKTERNLTVGQRIGRYLHDNGIMVSFVANKANIDYQRLHEITKGKRKNITPEEFLSICTILEEDPNVLIHYGD